MNIYLKGLDRCQEFIFQFLVTLDAGVFLGIKGNVEKGYSQDKNTQQVNYFSHFAYVHFL